MMFDRFNLAVLRSLLCLQLLSGWCLIQITVRGVDLNTICIDIANASSMLDVTCSYRIEVVSIYYEHRQGISSVCSQSSTGSQQCHAFLQTGQELKTSDLYNLCSYSLFGCNIPVGPLPTTGCSTLFPFNFILMEYRCVPETDFMDLCGEVDVNITSTVKHLVYFRKFDDDPFQNCTCSIQGAHDLTAVNAGIRSPTRNDCKPNNLWIKRVHTNRSEANTNISQPKGQLINVDFNRLQSSYIRMIRNCTTITPPVWFKIKPAEGETVRIQCGESIYIPSSASSPKPSSPRTTTTGSTSTSAIISTLSDTSTKDHEHNTLPITEKNTKVPVIVGSVVGSLVLIITLIIVGVLVYRRNLNLSRRNDSTKRTTNGTSEYDNACEMRIPSYVSVINDPDRDQRQDGTTDNVLEGNDSSEYEDVDTNNGHHMPTHEYENTNGVNESIPENINKLLQEEVNTYENANTTNGNRTSILYMNEFCEDTNQDYSTLDPNVDHTGNYEKLKL